MADQLNIIYTNEKHIEAYNKAVDLVARERKYLSTVNGFSIESSTWYVNHMISNNFAQYFGFIDNHFIGWCDINPKNIPEFSHVGVLGMGLLPDYRNKGYGKKLLIKTIEHAKNTNKLEKVELAVFESNKNAIKLYESVGFQVEGKRIKARKIDNNYENEIEMGLIF